MKGLPAPQLTVWSQTEKLVYAAKNAGVVHNARTQVLMPNVKLMKVGKLPRPTVAFCDAWFLIEDVLGEGDDGEIPDQVVLHNAGLFRPIGLGLCTVVGVIYPNGTLNFHVKEVVPQERLYLRPGYQYA